MEWELEQLEKLKELQAVYGWDDDDKNLQARKKAIMKKGLQRLKASPIGRKTLSRVPQAEADEEESSGTWQDCLGCFTNDQGQGLGKCVLKVGQTTAGQLEARLNSARRARSLGIQPAAASS